MLTKEDLRQIAEKGISEQQICQQIALFKTGFPFLRIHQAASVNEGIMRLEEEAQKMFQEKWHAYRQEDYEIVKFVPASGAASRMFKDLFSFMSAGYDTPQTDFEKIFFEHITCFAFFQQLDDCCLKNEGKSVQQLLEGNNYKTVLKNLLADEGMGYGQLPKALLTFHQYVDGARTPIEEHMMEAAQYASCHQKATLHFTISPEHEELFKQKVAECRERFEEKNHIGYEITYSRQKSSTDTIAVNLDNTLFRTKEGQLLFRPAGHGALIENLNDIDADVVFIKNIDNIVPDRLRADTVDYKEILAGILIDIQAKVFYYLKRLDQEEVDDNLLQEALYFVESQLCCKKTGLAQHSKELKNYLKDKLNRPIRVCGVVKNAGEPGGGPFLAYNNDGSVSPQILESSQIDKANASYMKMFREGTHFNPVDLVCALRDYQGRSFNLLQFTDPQTGFISQKSSDGKELKALELPGLWNGAMSNWNTVFVEVPLTTFTPVKTVNDLLRREHQASS